VGVREEEARRRGNRAPGQGDIDGVAVSPTFPLKEIVPRQASDSQGCEELY